MSKNELEGITVAVVGGDLRMLEHMRRARAAGATVQHYGFIPGAAEAAGRPQAASLADAVRGRKSSPARFRASARTDRYSPNTPTRLCS